MAFQKSIIISGTPVSGKGALTAALAEKYHWPVIHSGGMLREQHRLMYPNDEVSFENWYGTLKGSNLKKMNDELTKKFEAGSVIGDSRFISHLDQTKCFLVFIDADLTIRAERAAKDIRRLEYFGKPIDAIVKILQKREMDEMRIGQELFGIDYRDPKYYNLVLHTDQMTVAQEVEAIATALKRAKG